MVFKARYIYGIAVAIFACASVGFFLYNTDRSSPEISFQILNENDTHTVRDIEIEVHVSDDKRIDNSFHFDIEDLFGLGVLDFATTNKKEYTQTIDFSNLTEEQVTKLVSKNIFKVTVTARDALGKTTKKSISINLSSLLK